MILICNGCFIVATHNAAHDKEDIFPNPFINTGNYIVKAILFFIGFSIILLTITLLSIFFGAILLSINTGFIVLLIPIFMLLIYEFICLNLRFYMTLNFKDWFSFKKKLAND